jgi:hypothetical protein
LTPLYNGNLAHLSYDLLADHLVVDSLVADPQKAPL